MSKTDESPSASDPEAPRVPRRRPFLRDEWRELNAAQLVFIATGTVAGMFGLFGGVLVVISAFMGDRGMSDKSIRMSASIPSIAALACAIGALVFTRSSAARRMARQECGPAVLMALTGLLGVVIAWLVG